MIVTWIVELETKPAFTARRKVKNFESVNKLISVLKRDSHNSSFRIYDDDFIEIKEEKK